MIVASLTWIWIAQSAAGYPFQLTKPEPPLDTSDLLLRTALQDLLKEPRRELDPKYGPVIIAKEGAAISARILPADWEPGFALLSREEILALKSSPARFYLRITTTWLSPNEVDVSIYAGPVGSRIPLCCWRLTKRYERAGDGWKFVRLVYGAIH